MFPFYGFSEKLILIGILLGMICNVTTTGPAPSPLLNNIKCKFKTILQNKFTIVHCYAAGLEINQWNKSQENKPYVNILT